MTNFNELMENLKDKRKHMPIVDHWFCMLDKGEASSVYDMLIGMSVSLADALQKAQAGFEEEV